MGESDCTQQYRDISKWTNTSLSSLSAHLARRGAMSLENVFIWLLTWCMLSCLCYRRSNNDDVVEIALEVDIGVDFIRFGNICLVNVEFSSVSCR